ncbi:MAG TPA: alpha/beta hydrolase [Ktedonobacterales bacterium]|nr:alpha/beta hydrolase [Ktedonobacterales bacterium]
MSSLSALSTSPPGRNAEAPGARPPLAEVWTTVAGRRIFARINAQAAPPEQPPIVLVHGLGVSGRYLVPTARLLAAHYPVYLPDLPGFGRSAKAGGYHGIQELADLLLAWMDTWQLDRAVLLGNSLGCQIIAHAAARHPERIAAAILTNPTVDPASLPTARILTRFLRAIPHEPLSLAAIVACDYLTAGPLRMARSGVSMLRDRVQTRLPQMPMPTLVVRGEHDSIVSRAWAQEVTSLLPNGRLVELPGGCHGICYDAAPQLAATVCAFLERCLPSAPGATQACARTSPAQ